jgi:hypothetical protein
MVDGAGWYNYFNQMNAMGSAGSSWDIIGKLIGL